MNGLFQILKEQEGFAFTGRINILLKSNSQIIGGILQSDGALVNSWYQKLSGKDALVSLLYDDFNTKFPYKFVVEPEVLDHKEIKFHFTLNEVGAFLKEKLEEPKTDTVKPPMNLKLKINTEIFQNTENLSSVEFDLLKMVKDTKTIKFLYENSEYNEAEITQALIGLRKKAAIKVIK